MKLISSADLINITERTFNNVDSRLTGHARRVAYITYCVMKHAGGYTEEELHSQFLMALLHDIGAFKTSQIDALLTFDSLDIWEHAVYGSLFLKAFLPIARPDTVLFHHLPYKDFKYAWVLLEDNHVAALLCLADKIELCLRASSERECLKMLEAERGKAFSPYWVDAFIALNNAHGIIERIKSGECVKDFTFIADSFDFSASEKENVLEMLAYSIDFRSSFMVMHTVSTVSVSKTLAQMFKLPERDVYEITYGSYLHDLGKVATPVDILEKPGRLTDEEMIIMREHVNITREIIEPYINREICNIAVRHHERLDGSGYPQGLVKADLTLSERIVAVADVVSALVRKRSYKEAFDKDKTIAILQKTRDAGQLCAEVVDVVINNFDGIMDVAYEESERLSRIYDKFKSEHERIMKCVNNEITILKA